MEGSVLEETWRGSPQGGVISPLLALVALHGLETAITSSFGSRDRPQVVTYADDFVVLHPSRTGVEKAQRIAEEWLSGIGLRLKASKTRIAHTRLALDGPAGFDFLGFHIRRDVTDEYRTGSSLAELTQNGFDVPGGFVVTTRAYDSCTSRIRPGGDPGLRRSCVMSVSPS